MSDATLRWQAQRIEELEAQVADLMRPRLRADVRDIARLGRAFGIPLQQSRIVLCLYRAGGEFVSKGALIDALYEGRDEPADPINVLTTLLCRLRRIMPILSQYKIGYALTPDSVRRIDQILQRKQWRAA